MDTEMTSPPDPGLKASPKSPPPRVPPMDSAIKRRAPVACRRCRRMRSKCVHKGADPPCDSCREAGLEAKDCDFPKRGEPDNDRDYRHPRTRAEKGLKNDPTKMRRDTLNSTAGRSSPPSSIRLTLNVDEWDLLPPTPEIIEAVDMFTSHYFQLGFIPKRAFPDRIRQDRRGVSAFLMLSILSVSARFTPSLITRYGSGMAAANAFMEHASTVALRELYEEPRLDRCQAFYLLAISQQGSGYRNKSYINLGIAMRMAALLRLHKEETYILHDNPTPEAVTTAESARRTLWMLHSQDNLHSGPWSPVSLAASDITALLPADEQDFAEGREPRTRAALDDTPPAIENPNLIFDPRRSLFATLIQTHHLWGKVSRRAVRQDKSSRPWDAQSEYAQIKAKLDSWERSVPMEYRWDPRAMSNYKAEKLDLAYLGVTMVTRLCNIIIRKAYLTDILRPDTPDLHIRKFWEEMSEELFQNVKELYDQIHTQVQQRSPDDGPGAQMAAFCVYSCGVMATYLCLYPNICHSSINKRGPEMLTRTVAILEESRNTWPLAISWMEGLNKFVQDGTTALQEHTMADGGDPIPNALHPSLSHSSEPGPPTTPLDDKRRLARRQSQTQQHLAGSPGGSFPPVPTPDMLIDPSIRLPAPQPHQAQMKPQAPVPEYGHQGQLSQSPVPNAGRNATGFELLVDVAASFGQKAANMRQTSSPYNVHDRQEYFTPPQLTDGYEEQLRLYVDGGGGMEAQNSGFAGMYTY